MNALLRMSSGGYPGLRWGSLLRQVLSRSRCSDASVTGLARRIFDDRETEVFDSPWGRFRVPKPGHQVLAWLLHEIFVECEYQNQYVAVQPGDVVVDCGAHVGVFARFALQRGASRVVCIEMDDLNFTCLRENLGEQGQRVTLFHAALWSQECTLSLIRDTCSDRHHLAAHGTTETTRRTRTLDRVLEEAELARVNFIKVDVEGAEPEVLQGARETIRLHRPRLALAVYHKPSEEKLVREILRDCPAPYELTYRRLAAADAYILFGKASA